ncbi:MAG: hypothetical protein AVDCRST_MAG59-1642, partial [uncultured Thermomicrobiales bacterium]
GYPKQRRLRGQPGRQRPHSGRPSHVRHARPRPTAGVSYDPSGARLGLPAAGLLIRLGKQRSHHLERDDARVQHADL